MAETHDIHFNAKFLVDKFTHYEVYLFINGGTQTTLTISQGIVKDFNEKYGSPIANYIVYARIYFIENAKHLAPDVFKSPTHLRGTLHSLEEITSVVDI